jgi:hypothetical protein
MREDQLNKISSLLEEILKWLKYIQEDTSYIERK